LLGSYLAYNSETKEIELERIYSTLATKGIKAHVCPFNKCCREINLLSALRGKWFWERCRRYILQFLLIKPTCTLLEVLAYAFNIGNPNDISNVLESIIFVSVSLSLYYLVLFYQILHEELAYARPLLKFLTVKSVLFFTFWQAFFLEIFQNQIFGIFGLPANSNQGLYLLNVLESDLVCFEMVILSIVASNAYGHKDFEQACRKNWLLGGENARGLVQKFLKNVVQEAVTETLEDLRDLTQPFEKLEKTQVTIETKTDVSFENQNTSADKKEFQADVKETPRVIPNFLEKSPQKQGARF